MSIDVAKSEAIPGAASTAMPGDETLRDLLTPARLRSYLRVRDGDLSAALRLYEGNADATGVVLVTTGMVEVLIRNAMDRALTNWADRRGASNWFDHVPIDTQGCDGLERARQRATHHGRRPDHGKVVAELNLGFWRYLASKRYLTTLWTPALSRAFPNGPSDPLQRLREVD